MFKLFKISSFYLFIFLSFTFLYLFSFHTNIFISQSVLFYRGLMLLGLVSLFFIFIFFIFHKKVSFSLESLIAALILSISINLSIFIVFPVTFERSVTMYILNTLKKFENNSCGGLNKKELENLLVNEYVIKNKAVDKRINEQKVIDFIEEKNQCFGLTLKSKKFLKFSEIISFLYNL